MANNKVTMELIGLREIHDLILALPVQIKREPIIYRALHDGARVFVPEAKRLAPVLQDRDETRRQRGAIRSAIVQHADKKANDPTVLVRVRSRGYIFSAAGKDAEAHRAGNANYWWLQEFGTAHTPAQPFMRPAFESKKEPAARAVRDSLHRGVLAVARKLGFRT